MEYGKLKRALEGVLFAAGEPVTAQRLCLGLETDRATLDRAAQDLAEEYEGGKRGIRLLRLGGSYQLCSAPEQANLIRRTLESRKPPKLSQPALEVLAVVAYFQPVTRAYIDKIRAVGVSLLTSAGIAGIIVGFAAQKSLGMILAGIQLAIPQPIRLDDSVIVEGEMGVIEEIKLTYVVVRLWDQRRLILPVTYFLEKPFQNWTINSAQLLGTVYLYLDYGMPLEALRRETERILRDHPKWDGRASNVQVTDMKERYMEVRVLFSSSDSGSRWDLSVDVREKLLKFLQDNYPDCFVRTRIMDVDLSVRFGGSP